MTQQPRAPHTRAVLEAQAEHYRKQVELFPNEDGAWALYGETLSTLRRFDESRRAFERMLEITKRPEVAEYQLGFLDLLAGDVHRGWHRFQHRFQLKIRPEDYPDYARPRWSGEPLADKRLLLLPEQGIGDMIQMVRLIPEARRRAKSILINCPKHLRRFIEPLALPGEIVDTPEIDGDRYDLCMWLMSLPAALGPLSDEWLRASVPYLPLSDEARTRWKKKLEHLKGLKVGVIWNGNPDTGGDENRSLPGPMFRRFADVPGVQLVAMQFRDGRYPLPMDERDFIAYDASAEVGPWEDLGGAASAVDVLVSIDGSGAHLAGAMGLPVWLLVPYSGDFRWRAEGDTSPWYPGHRIFRQKEFGDWAEVVERIAGELDAMARSRGLDRAVQPQASAARGATPSFAPAIRSTGISQAVRGRHGYFVCNDRDKVVGRSLARYGEYSEREVDLFRRIVAPRATVVDAGAHIGAFAVPLARIVGPTGRVHAFEALRPLYYSLCANAMLNSLPQLECHDRVLGEAGSTLQVPDVQYDREFDFGGIDYRRFKDGRVRPVEALDDILDVKSLALLKIDVNGMERDVVRGARGLIAEHKPVLHVANGRPQFSKALVEEILGLGYRLYWLFAPLFNPENAAGNPENIFGEAVTINMIGVPKERPVLGGLPEVNPDAKHPAEP